MSLSKSGCSKSITKSDLDAMYYQGFAEGVEMVCENIIRELEVCKKVSYDLWDGEASQRAFQKAIEVVQSKLDSRERKNDVGVDK